MMAERMWRADLMIAQAKRRKRTERELRDMKQPGLWARLTRIPASQP
jgi:hypothetical protein